MIWPFRKREVRVVRTASPWGYFVNMTVDGVEYERTASGTPLWTEKGGGYVGFAKGQRLERLYRKTPVSETKPDEFSDMVRQSLPDADLSWMKKEGADY